MFKVDIIYDDFKDFEEALNIQSIILREVQEKKRNEAIWFLEHNSVITAGRSASDDDLVDKEMKIVQINRGGKWTYHGPGQLIIYIFLNLKNIFHPNEPDLQKFIKMLETWVLNSLEELGVTNLSIKPEINHGIWIEKNKISAIGIHIQKWVTSHGISININPDLKFFEKIIPCGVANHGVTSLEKEGCDKITKKILIESMIKNFFNIFSNYNCGLKK
jgi:lipoyl(octanoyl) transferase